MDQGGRMKERTFVMLFFIIAGLMYTGLYVYFHHMPPSEERKALDECIEEVSNNCKGLFNYASMLEDENARLNRLFRECRESR